MIRSIELLRSDLAVLVSNLDVSPHYGAALDRISAALDELGELRRQRTEGPLNELIRNYQRDAMATALKTDTATDLLIRACGLGGEWGEYLAASAVQTTTEANRLDELGDCFWYAAAVAEVCEIQLADLLSPLSGFTPLPLRTAEHVTIEIGKVLEYAKKVGGHKRQKPIEELIKPLTEVLYQLIARAWGSTQKSEPGDVLKGLLAANIAKLRARHATGKFDPNYGTGGALRCSRNPPETQFELAPPQLAPACSACGATTGEPCRASKSQPTLPGSVCSR